MTGDTNRTGRVAGLTALAAGVMLAWGSWGAGVVNAQIQFGPDFKPAVVFEADVGGPYGLASADFLDADGNPGQDGYPEIAVAGAGVDLIEYCDDPTSSHSIRVFHNTGDWDDPLDGLVPHWDATIPSGIRAMELAFADVTGINGPDLVLLGYDPGAGLGYLLVYQADGTGEFQNTPYQIFTADVTLRGLVTADLDGDGDIDVAAAGSDCDNVHVQRDVFVVFENQTANPNSPVFSPMTIQLDIANDQAPGDIVGGDFYAFSPGQSFRDLVTPNPAAGSFTKIRNMGNLQFAPTTVGIATECTPGWGFVTATADHFGADGFKDFAAVLPDDLFLGVFLGNGLGDFQTFCDDAALGYQLYPPDYEKLHAHGVASGSFDGNARPDLAVALWRDYSAGGEPPEWFGAVAVLLGKTDGTFRTDTPQQAWVFSVEDSNGYQIVAGSIKVEIVDLNDDGFDDIVVANHYTDNISVLINDLLVTTGPGG